MDQNCLRMIANPYLLKKNKNQSLQGKQMKKLKINNNLYLYLESKYPNTYISPVVFYELISIIDDKIEYYIIDTLIKEMIDAVLIKFDNEPC